MTGGISPHPINATPEIQEITNTVKEQLEKKLGTNYSIFQAISYKKQLVNGMNYFIKVKTDNGYDHIRVYEAFKGTPNLVSVQQHKSLEDDITYF
ncbi:cystatin A3, partial [Dictyostelium discoideum AX4]|uniref:Cystatin-A3 n=1 Tax=Dictyostelium discoideum TaxID=44689 RepID=CYTA3_DICDI